MTNMVPGISAAQYLMGLGEPPLPKNGAVAVVAVLHAESGLNPGSQGVQSTETGGVRNPRGAYGLASWNGPRQQDYTNFVDKHQLGAYDSVDNQLHFVLNECASKPRYQAAWAAITNPSLPLNSMIAAFVEHYEIPKNSPAEIARAAAYAAQLAPLVPDTVPPIVLPTPKPGPSPTQPIPTTPTDQGIPDMNPAIIALLVQALPPLFRILEAVLQHAATQLPTTPPPIVHPPAPVPIPWPQGPTQPPQVNWAALLQGVMQVISQAIQQK